MKMRDIVKALVGAGFVYVAMAACSAGTGQGGSGHAGAGGQGGVDIEDGGMMDVLTNPVPDAQADPMNGSRLKAKYILAEDGSKAYAPGAWYDSQRQEYCGFSRAADGKLRCLPEAKAYVSTLYADASCSQPLVGIETACSPPKYAYAYDAACSSQGGTRVYSLGSVVNPAKVYYGTPGSCYGAAPEPSFTYYTVGAEIAPSAFVGGSEQHD